ncbi:MAG: energy transducer TonB [Blastocatellia bacterium]
MFLHYPKQASFAQGKQSSFDLEKRAVADAQQILAQDLDAELPKLPFANWFKQIIGPEARVVWQLSECGEITEAPNGSNGDIRACVEAVSIFANRHKVIVMIAVGTFKKGMIGAPAFHFGVIEHEKGLSQIHRLRDLPGLLSAPGNPANISAVKLPDVKAITVRLITNGSYLADLLESGAPGSDQAAITDEADESPPPPPAPPPKVLPVSWGRAINKAQPRYPPGAKRFNITGSVDVQITISAAGRVTEAKAISGHPLLRPAAEEAALLWVFEPATMNGVPVETQTVLTFAFKVPKE